MKKNWSCLLLCLSLATRIQPAAAAADPDSVYLFSYATSRNNHHNGLQYAWSRDQQDWRPIGNDFGYLKSDYGRWGAEKRMLSPYLFAGPDGLWHCIWSLNEQDPAFAHAASADLVNWKRQSYPLVKQGSNVVNLVARYDARQGYYTITYNSADGKSYGLTTKDFRTYGPVKEMPALQGGRQTVDLPDGKAEGQVHRVPWAVVGNLINAWELKQFKAQQDRETTRQDSQRFAGLQPVQATISLQPGKAKPISDLLMGVFFEDINYAADGGLYAELVQNRDFEYTLSDKEGHDKNWNSKHSWTLKGEQATFRIDTATPLHVNNPHYAVLETKVPGAALVNTGYDGIPLRKGEKYELSMFARQQNGKVLVRLVNKQGEVLAQATVNTSAGKWQVVKAMLTPSADAADAQLELQPLTAGSLSLDMISLFPQHTFKGRKNGLRSDLAQLIADIHPRFVRFPGGCVAHGDGLANIYRWKNTVGPLEARKPQRNLWGYHQSAGLGYFEYFQFCEDIGATALPVIAAGVPCQNSATGGGGQQGGIPMQEMDEYIQEICDLVEYANGDVHTTWGKKRAAAGHPKPFNLKYIGIGNEDLITDIFEERFTMIFEALKKKHPEITVIGTVGPACEGTDYTEGWDIARKLRVPIVDEHYYQSPGWFINNQDYYDKYDRSASKVYLGEYAAHLPGRPNNLETALAEALYLTSLERNGDVVSMASYAPLLARQGHTQWSPDLIYFDNTAVHPTVGYYVQQLYGVNAGDEYLPGVISLSNNQDAVKKRVAYSVVRDSRSKDVIVKIVNLLPVTVNSTFNLGNISVAGTMAVKTVLTGHPADLKARPVSSPYKVSEQFNDELPPYSLTVIRISTK